jgi:hypothetical protein
MTNCAHWVVSRQNMRVSLPMSARVSGPCGQHVYGALHAAKARLLAPHTL